MSNPLVSVLVPAYNHENYVQGTINSIIAQTYQNIELIVIDDGSKDGTFSKLQELKPECEKRFVRVVFETKKNEGTCKTLNKLISCAEGEFIYLIASDDLAKPQAIEKEVSFLSNHSDYVLAVGDNELVNQASQRIGWNKKNKSVGYNEAFYKTFGQNLQATNNEVDFHSDDFGAYETFITGNYIPNGYMIKTAALKSIGGFTQEAPLEDWYLMLQLSKIGKFKYLDDVLFSYRWHDNNTVKRKEYMQKIGYQTYCYEKNLVNKLADKRWKELFDKHINKKRMKFNFLNVLKYYSLKNMDAKKYVIELFGHQFVIKEIFYSQS